MPVNRFRGAAPRGRQPDPTYPVIRPHKLTMPDGKPSRHHHPTSGYLDLTLLDEYIFGILMHWVFDPKQPHVRGRSEVCKHYEGLCPFHSYRPDYSGWMAVYDHVGRSRAVLRLSKREADVLVARLGNAPRWAGLRIIVQPINAGLGKEITVSRNREDLPAAEIGTHSIRATICCVLGIDHIPPQGPDPENAQDGEEVPLA